MAHLDEDSADRIIHEIYEAASDCELWPQVMNRIADALGGESSHLMVLDGASGEERLGILERQDPAAQVTYMTDYFPNDIRVPRMLRAPIGAIITDGDVWSREERDGSALYNEYQRVHRLHEITGANLSIGGHSIWFGVARGTPVPFEDAELGLLRRVLPHIRRSLRLWLEIATLGRQRDSLAALSSGGGKAVLILDRHGRVQLCNGAAEAMVRGGLLRLRAGRLGIADAAAARCLEKCLGDLRSGRPFDPDHGDALLTDRESGAQFGLRLQRCADPVPSRSGALLIVTIAALSADEAFSEDEVARFARLFGFTPAETRVVAAVTRPGGLAAFAAEHGVKPDTTRKQLKAAMAKAGCRSQKELVRMIERYCFLSLR